MKLSDEDKKLVDFSKKTLNDLGVEAKTVQGFLANFLANKYGVKTQEDYQKLIDGGEINTEVPKEIPPTDPRQLNLVS